MYEKVEIVSRNKADKLRMAVNEARHAGDIDAEIEAAFDLAIYRIETLDWRLVESLCEEFTGMNRTDEERYYGAVLIIEIAPILVENFQPALAAQLLYQAVKIGKDVEMGNIEFGGRIKLGDALRASGNSRDAVANYEAALDMLDDVSEAAPFRAEISLRLGQAYLELNRIEQARLYFNRVLTMASQAEDERSRGIVLGWLGLTNIQANNFEASVSPLEQSAKRLRTEEDLWSFLGIVLANLSDAYGAVGKIEDQRRSLVEAREIFYKTDQNDLAADADQAIKQMDMRKSAF